MLLGLDEDAVAMLIEQTRRFTKEPEAGKLKRLSERPILEGIKEHSWESKYVLNTAAFRLKGKIYLIYRAYGDDDTSRLGLAVIGPDGRTVEERLDKPIFWPVKDCEGFSRGPGLNGGCEDPRVTIIGKTLYMLYTAFDGRLAQIALASISIDDFIARNWDAWRRYGLSYPGVPDKDAVLFPEKINGKFAVYHRIDPDMWLSYLDNLECPWPKEGNAIVMGPRPGMLWDSEKIGAGASPIKTKYGWLHIYHGVDLLDRTYRLGVALTALDDPAEVLYRSPNAILEPEIDFELGMDKGAWTPKVVFTCGAVPMEDKEILGDNDEILVYYGGADTAIGAAGATVGELIPEEVRERISKAAAPAAQQPIENRAKQDSLIEQSA